MAELREDVYCTLLMSDSYLPGAAVLAHSLRDAGSTKKLAVLVTMETLAADTITELKALYDYLIPVERIRNRNLTNLYLMGRPDLSFTFTKIALWRQTQFRKIVYLDADVVALRAMDELFDIEAPFAAAPDIGWPDAFNSGVMVISPNMGEYWALQTMAATGESFDGADQGLLNQYFEHRPWQRLKFTYNCTPNAEYQWEPAYRYYKRDISAVHFIGKSKPWSGHRSGKPGVYGELLARWWAVFDRHFREPKAVAPSTFHQTRPQYGQGQAKGAEGEIASHIQSPLPAPKPVSIPQSTIEPEPPINATESTLTGPDKAADTRHRGSAEQTPKAPHRHIPAPAVQWDATRFEPPAQSRPEAANFPTQTYTFSDSHSLFKAPQSYPEPPKDMWYKVPDSQPKPAEKPTPIFPWEQEPNRPKPTRVFADDLPPDPAPAPALPSPTHTFSTIHYQDEPKPAPEEIDQGVTSPESVSSPKSAEEQWQAFQQGSVNAWDNVPGIENYVRAVMETHGRRGKTQVLHQAIEDGESGPSLRERRNRRESLILTDFPTAVERPSLPVTPAPVRRPMFWGEERDEAGELPAAEGVPDQTDWVCPQCGFSSVNASDFQRHAGAELSTIPYRRRSSEAPPVPPKPHRLQNAPKLSIPSSPPIPHPRSGLSPSGVPLASLTSPEFLILQMTSSSLSSPTVSAEAGSQEGEVAQTPNPNEQLEQLRRSSLVEFEHLKRDEHPNPPLRALPEHSVLTAEDARPGEVSQSGDEPLSKTQAVDKAKDTIEQPSTAAVKSDASMDQPSVGRVSKSVSTDDQLKGQQTAIREVVGDFPVDQPPAPYLDPVHTPEAQGVAGRDFATIPEPEKEQKGLVTSQGVPETPTPSSTRASTAESSSFAEPTLLPSSVFQGQSQTTEKASSGSNTSSTSHEESSTQSSSTQSQSSSVTETIKAGKTMFIVPNFDNDSSAGVNTKDDDIISPKGTRKEAA